MYITRHMEKPVMELNEQYPVLLLTGPRQVGKTTMLEHLIEVEGKGRKKVSLDDLTLRELAKTDPKMFFQLYQPPLLIDEVQYAPELFPYIKIMVDERHQPGDFWLTGSQLFKMMEGVQESLAGRVALLHLSPLSQSEIMKRPPEPPFSPGAASFVRTAERTPNAEHARGLSAYPSGRDACPGHRNLFQCLHLLFQLH